jgi:sortase (surface protein transpeptidase)
VGTPLRVIAPAIGLDVPLVPTGLTADRALAVPPFGTAGWFDLGPRPGEGGPAVLAGHVDSRRGPDVFYDLRRLLPGDEIHVLSDDGDTRTFTVEAVEQTPKDELPVDRIWDGSTAPVLRLITCGGTFDETQRTYRSNVIVYARATGTALAA